MTWDSRIWYWEILHLKIFCSLQFWTYLSIHYYCFYACWINPLRNDQFGMSVVHHWVCMSICYDIHNTFVISDSAGRCSLNSRNISNLQIMTAQWQESLSILDFCNKNAKLTKKEIEYFPILPFCSNFRIFTKHFVRYCSNYTYILQVKSVLYMTFLSECRDNL